MQLAIDFFLNLLLPFVCIFILQKFGNLFSPETKKSHFLGEGTLFAFWPLLTHGFINSSNAHIEGNVLADSSRTFVVVSTQFTQTVQRTARLVPSDRVLR
jgi:hypothetical protein